MQLEFEAALAQKKIFITGNTGFTGSWICLWLELIGAEVMGYALRPETSPALFNILDFNQSIQTTYGNINNYLNLLKSIEDFQPDLILHLAAQPLVKRSYDHPLLTFTTNTLGTAHVLEAARAVKSVKGVLCVTTDKVYKNNEWLWPYRENDPLGGKDPYSASKSAAEMIIQSYMNSYPWTLNKGPAIATARGGNIIGGGDWSSDRLIPDFVRAVVNNTSLTLRYPHAIRPWQHILALVQAYLMVLSGLLSEDPGYYARAWNFGPLATKQLTVANVIELMGSIWQQPQICYTNDSCPEAGLLALDSSLAHKLLGWNPAWTNEQVIIETANWYKSYYQNESNVKQLTIKQIQTWREDIF